MWDSAFSDASEIDLHGRMPWALTDEACSHIFVL